MSAVPPIGPLQPCWQLPTLRIEACGPAGSAARGTLDWVVYSCEKHEVEHEDRIVLGAALGSGAGKTFSVFKIGENNQACGDVIDFKELLGGRFRTHSSCATTSWTGRSTTA